MLGLMMDYPLTLTHILERSAKIYPSTGNRQPGSMTARCTAIRIATSIGAFIASLTCSKSLGVQAGDRIGTLCWNSSRHLELYFAVPCAGACCTHSTCASLPTNWRTSSTTPRTG